MNKTLKLRSKEGTYFLIDYDQKEKVLQYKWRLNPYGYVCTNRVFLARFIMNAPKELQVDHINGDKLDNRKQNLRLCTMEQNQFNRPKRKSKSGFRGVYWVERKKKWRAAIKYRGKTIHLGYFHDKKKAAIRYNEEIFKIAGEFARLNKIK